MRGRFRGAGPGGGLTDAPGGDIIENVHDRATATSSSFAADAILPLVQRPSRYIDGELNLASGGFREGAVNVLLVFPDVYEIGMSHQGIRYLYHRLAGMEGVGVELAFAPWPDAERLMRATGEPLRSLQTGTPAARFDVIGFSVTYELHYTNLLLMLDLSGLGLEASRRRDDDPLVIAGGPCCTNPLPFLGAVDAIFLGDGEDSLPDAVLALQRLGAGGVEGGGAAPGVPPDARRSPRPARPPRAARREALARIDGVYVEGITNAADGAGAVRARTHRFSEGELPRRPIVASSETVHQRLPIEIMRGCARGCRFCHAGMFYRPCRERSVDEIVGAALEGLDATGWDEVSLLSLSTSDYSRLDELLARLVPELERRHVSLALPSLRPETITETIVSASSTVTKSGFTLAPEAGTERLRRVIRKDFTDAEILEGVAKILAGGWQTLKLYFMIGLPTETDEDLEGIAGLVGRVMRLPRRGGRFNLSVSISPFVPKPHTPFQWEAQCSIEEFRRKEELLSRLIRRGRVELGLREPSLSILEGILARGDRRLWPVLLRAYELGCRFDGWTEWLRFELWERALAENGLSIAELIAARPLEGPLPWDGFELHGTKAMLRAERERAYEGESAAETAGEAPSEGEPDEGASRAAAPRTEAAVENAAPPRAEVALCSGATPAHATAAESGAAPADSTAAPSADRPVFRYRLLYEKIGRARFLSHIETMNVIQRALRRSGLPLHFTEGFHPHPRISAGPSLAVGMEGLREFLDVELTADARPSPELLNGFLPAGIRMKACAGPFTRKEGKLPGEARFRYLLAFDALRALLRSAAACSGVLSERERMWYLIGKELDASCAAELYECGEPVDPALRFEAEWTGLFERGAAFTDEKGRERSTAGCSARLVKAAEAAATMLPSGGGERAEGCPSGEAAGEELPTAGTAVLLALPGLEGAPRAQDLLTVFLPKSLAPIVRIRRLEMLYICEEGLIDPMALIEARRLAR